MADALPKHQRVAWLIRPGVVEVREVPLLPPGPGQVLVRIERALVGGTDRKAFARGHPQIPMPGPFGHRYSGRVAAVGEGVTAWTVGQAIMGVHSAPCLECGVCRAKRQHLCPHVMREKVLGAFAQYLCIPAAIARQNLYARPDSLSSEQAALLEPLACVVHGLELLDWREVGSVLVLGLGAMGLLFAQLLPRYTRAALTGAGRRAERLQLAQRFGLSSLVDVDKHKVNSTSDVVIECTGKLDGWQLAFDLASPGGQVLLFGGLPRETVFGVDSYRLHYEEVRLLGSFHFSPADVARAREHLIEGAIDPTGLISATLPLSRIGEALERLQSGDAIQCAIDPWA